MKNMTINKTSNILILHGWGLYGEKYKDLANILVKKGYKVFCPDMPGFGKEPLKNNEMKLDDYVEFIDDFISKNILGQKKLVIIGHSFGGRVAIKYCFNYQDKVSKLILSGVPIIRDVSFSKRLVYLAVKTGNKIFGKSSSKIKNYFRKGLYYIIGEWDYYKAGNLKQVFKNIINEDLIQYVTKIKIPTLLIWGKEDHLVSVKILDRVKLLMPDAKIVVIPNSGHKLPYDNSETFAKNVVSFINEN